MYRTPAVIGSIVHLPQFLSQDSLNAKCRRLKLTTAWELYVKCEYCVSLHLPPMPSPSPRQNNSSATAEDVARDTCEIA